MVTGNYLTLVLVVTLFVIGCGGGGEELPETSTEVASGEALGQQVFSNYCVVCHQANGLGVEGIYPPLSQTEWILGDKGRIIRLVLNGMTGPVEVKGVQYNNAMTPNAFLTDEQIAAVLTYIRANFGNNASPVTVEEVAAVRAGNEKQGLWQASELEEKTGIPGHEENGTVATE